MDVVILVFLKLPVNAFIELAPKELNSHNGEYQPEDQTDQQHVDNRGDSVHQGIHHNLNKI